VDLIWGLPAHPLMVHAPVVLLPLASFGAIVLATSAKHRQRYDLFVGTGAVAALITALLANNSGERLSERLELEAAVERHENLAGTTLVLAAAFALLTLVNVATARIRAFDRSTIAGAVLPVVAACMGVLATIWMVRTGHEGARLVWEKVVE
jgi:uncharacterized membrane protein